MIALINSPVTPVPTNTTALPVVPVRRAPATLITRPPARELAHEARLGIPSCSPVVLHELLKIVSQQLPQTYWRAGQECGLTLERTETLLREQAAIVSAARLLKLAQLIACEPAAHDVFAAAGQAVYQVLQKDLSRTLKFTVRHLPRTWRVRLALNIARKAAPAFAGSTNQLIIVDPSEASLYFSIRDGLFTDRVETIGCAYAYYRSFFSALLWDFAHVKGRVLIVRRPRVQLHQCNFKLSWEG